MLNEALKKDAAGTKCYEHVFSKCAHFEYSDCVLMACLIDFHFAKPVDDHFCKELVCLCHMSTTIKTCLEHILKTK
jgi:hypothetical protein